MASIETVEGGDIGSAGGVKQLIPSGITFPEHETLTMLVANEMASECTHVLHEYRQKDADLAADLSVERISRASSDRQAGLVHGMCCPFPLSAFSSFEFVALLSSRHL